MSARRCTSSINSWSKQSVKVGSINSLKVRGSPSMASKISSEPQKQVLKEKFSSAVPNHTARRRLASNSKSKVSMLGQSLFDLSLGLISSNEVIAQIKRFRRFAPLHLYRYSGVIDLLNASSKCPPDIQLQILMIGRKMIKVGNVAPSRALHTFVQYTQNLIYSHCRFATFGKDQEKPHKKLSRLLEAFKRASLKPRKGGTGTLSTLEIEKILESLEKEQGSLPVIESSEKSRVKSDKVSQKSRERSPEKKPDKKYELDFELNFEKAIARPKERANIDLKLKKYNKLKDRRGSDLSDQRTMRKSDSRSERRFDSRGNRVDNHIYNRIENRSECRSARQRERFNEKMDYQFNKDENRVKEEFIDDDDLEFIEFEKIIKELDVDKIDLRKPTKIERIKEEFNEENELEIAKIENVQNIIIIEMKPSSPGCLKKDNDFPSDNSKPSLTVSSPPNKKVELIDNSYQFPEKAENIKLESYQEGKTTMPPENNNQTEDKVETMEEKSNEINEFENVEEINKPIGELILEKPELIEENDKITEIIKIPENKDEKYSFTEANEIVQKEELEEKKEMTEYKAEILGNQKYNIEEIIEDDKEQIKQKNWASENQFIETPPIIEEKMNTVKFEMPNVIETNTEAGLTTNETIVEEKNETIVEEKNETIVEEKNETIIEEKNETIVEEKNETIIEEKNETIVEENNETIVEEKNETIVEEKNETIVEENNETIVEENNETIVEEKNETIIEEKNETIVEENNETIVEEKNETIIEEKNETIVEEKNETIVEENNETIVEEKNETIVEEIKPEVIEINIEQPKQSQNNKQVESINEPVSVPSISGNMTVENITEEKVQLISEIPKQSIPFLDTPPKPEIKDSSSKDSINDFDTLTKGKIVVSFSKESIDNYENLSNSKIPLSLSKDSIDEYASIPKSHNNSTNEPSIIVRIISESDSQIDEVIDIKDSVYHSPPKNFNTDAQMCETFAASAKENSSNPDHNIYQIQNQNSNDNNEKNETLKSEIDIEFERILKENPPISSQKYSPCTENSMSHLVPIIPKEISRRDSLSIAKFLKTEDSLDVRTRKGKTIFQNLDDRRKQEIIRLARMFTSWDVAYKSARTVWGEMNSNDEFECDALISQVPKMFGDFLIGALRTFADIDGFMCNYKL